MPGGEETVVGDPHIFPFNGPKFDFTGIDGKYYNFICHDQLQANIRIKGDQFTVMSEFCLTTGDDTVRVICHDDEHDYIEVIVNNKLMKYGSSQAFEHFNIEVQPHLVIIVTEQFRFHAQKCSKSPHLYDKLPHLDMTVKCLMEYDGKVHGILGQSVNPEFQAIEGEEDDYLVSGPFINDSKFVIDMAMVNAGS